MIVLWIVLIAAAIWWFRRWNPRGIRYEPTGVERARDILAERFAQGDITSEEYAERLDSLGRLNPATSDRR